MKVHSHDCKNCDHPKILASGSAVYLAYFQATNHFISLITDAGRSFTQTDVLRQGVVGFSEGGVLDAHRNAWFAWADHVNGWNVWYRSSTDGGATWSTPGQRMSAYIPAESQSRPAGFLFPYGDYMRIELNPNCGNNPVMVWGEGHDWAGARRPQGTSTTARSAAPTRKNAAARIWRQRGHWRYSLSHPLDA